MTPEEEADALLAVTSTEVLLQTFASLTHVIHDMAGDPDIFTPDKVDKKRAERDLIKTEILKRTGDLK